MDYVGRVEALYDQAATAISGAAEAILISRAHRILEEAAQRTPETPNDLRQMVQLLRWLVRNSEMDRRDVETVEAGLVHTLAEIGDGNLTAKAIDTVRLAQALGDKREPHIGDVAERILEAVSGGAPIH